MNSLKTYFFILFFSSCTCINSQVDSAKIYKNRRIFLLSSTGALSAGSLIYLNNAWYGQYNTGKFHFFDDSQEWLQMDKVGHVLSNFQMSHLMIKSYRWIGFNKKQSLFIGGTIGLSYLTIIELMDGYSKGWGFSWSDMGANVLGCAVAMSQVAIWNEQRINLKFSVHTTHLAQYNPDLLGRNFSEQILKDYNGQTYWLSISPFSFVKTENKLPKWLSLSIGYGADGMLGAHYNSVAVIDPNGFVKTINRERQYYLSFDVDFSKIKTKHKALKAVFNAINILKIPAPTLEFQNGKTKFYYFYF